MVVYLLRLFWFVTQGEYHQLQWLQRYRGWSSWRVIKWLLRGKKPCVWSAA